MLARRIAFDALARCVTALLLLSCPAALPAQAQGQQSWYPWNKKEEPKKKEPAKEQAQAAKPKPAAEPKADAPKTDAPKGSVDTQADLSFWNSVKDRGRPEELRAYLQQFPEGRFAELAKLRLKEAEEAKVSGTTAAGVPDANVMREIQERLYKLNYPITRFDGGVDDGTDRAIKAWQIKHEFAPSGTLNAEQLKVLRDIVPAKTWGAIAYPIVGTSTMVFAKTSRQEAESQALADCKAKNGVACKVYAAAEAECTAVAMFRSKGPDGRDYVTHFASRQVGTALATLKVLQLCNLHPQRAGNRCQAVGAACGTSATTAEQLNKGNLPADPARKLPPANKAKEQDT